MDRNIESLNPEFRDIIKTVLANLKDQGHILKPFFTLRTPEEQAKYWRQSRTTAQITTAIEMLESEGAYYLADALNGVGPQYGRWATNALPGQSWHNHGKAIDCYVIDEKNTGSAIWRSDHDGYKAYAEESVKFGLTSGYYWQRRDSVHVQAQRVQVLRAYNWQEIDELMQRRFA